MRYTVLVTLVVAVLQSSAQRNLDLNNYQLDFDMVAIQGDTLKGVVIKTGQRKSVWKHIGTVREIKVVTKPCKKTTKIQVIEAKSDMNYVITYYLVDGQLSSYTLTAQTPFQKKSASLFGVIGDRLEIELIRCEAGYIGAATISRLLEKSSVPLYFPASKKLHTHDTDFCILLPVFSVK